MTTQNTIGEDKIGSKVKWHLDDGTPFTGTITGIANDEHVFTIVNGSWPWIVRSEAIEFI